MHPASRAKERQAAKRRSLPAALIGLAVASAAQAEPAMPAMSASIERHFTSNALDSERAVADWVTLLRGSLQRQWGDADANAGLGADFETTSHDRVTLEDDRTLALSAHAFRRLSTALELRGALAYRVTSTGDDLDLGAAVIGTRAVKHVVEAEAGIGIDLGHATALILQASDSFETTGPTRFDHELLPPVRLDPDVNRLRLLARLTRTAGALAFGGQASVLAASVERLASPPVALSFTLAGLGADLAMRKEGGPSLGLAFGVEWLRGSRGIYSELRPAWQARIAQPLPGGFELRGAWLGRYETADSDDPLASWLERAELELGWKAGQRLALASGIFRAVKQNLLFENAEKSRGFYAEASYAWREPLAVVVRVDFTRTFKSVLDSRKQTVDAFVGLRTKL